MFDSPKCGRCGVISSMEYLCTYDTNLHSGIAHCMQMGMHVIAIDDAVQMCGAQRVDNVAGRCRERGAR